MTAIGQAGNLTANTSYEGEPIAVSFDEPLTDPVIAMMGTNNGGHKFSLRILEIQTNGDGDATGFTFTIDEWENHDGQHPAVEQFNWIAIESGVHTLPDGRTIEAGYSDADSNGENVSLAGDFNGTTPTVLTTVASNDGTSYTDSDPYNISGTGFDLQLEEAESQDGTHGLESVGWIAIEPGNGTDSGSATNATGTGSSWDNNVALGDTFTNAITVGETQTQPTGGDPGNIIFRNQDVDEIDLRFEEDTSVDGDTGSPGQTVGLVTFEQGMILCFTPGTMIETPYGPREITRLRQGDLVLTMDDGPQPLRWMSQITIGAERLAADPKLAPIRIKAGSIAPGVPAADMDVSPQHRMLISGWKAELYAGASEVLVPARGLLNDSSIRPVAAQSVTYVHMLFDRHQVVFANGAPSESLHPGELDRAALDAPSHNELLKLFPELRTESRGYGQTARTALSVQQSSVLA